MGLLMGNFQNLNQMKITEKPTIKASWLGSHEYCEYKWYLENVLKEDIPIVRAMIIGKEVHKIKEDEFKKVAKPTTPKEFLKSKLYTITKEITLEKEFSKNNVIDVLNIISRMLFLIKGKSEPIPNDIPGKCRACVLHKQEKCSF